MGTLVCQAVSQDAWERSVQPSLGCTDTVSLWGQARAVSEENPGSPFPLSLESCNKRTGRTVLGWNRLKCIPLTHNSSCPEVSLAPSTFHVLRHLILTKTGRHYYRLTDIETEIQVKEITNKVHMSTPKRVTNSLTAQLHSWQLSPSLALLSLHCPRKPRSVYVVANSPSSSIRLTEKQDPPSTPSPQLPPNLDSVPALPQTTKPQKRTNC